jgi:hypothetical protein
MKQCLLNAASQDSITAAEDLNDEFSNHRPSTTIPTPPVSIPIIIDVLAKWGMQIKGKFLRNCAIKWIHLTHLPGHRFNLTK